MRTTPIYPDNVRGVLTHNTRHYQVLVFMNGLACEILKKDPDAPRPSGGRRKHADYPSLYMQGDAAAEFLAELENAQSVLRSDRDIDSLLLSMYDEALH